MTYASQTSVPVDRSKAEIERVLLRYGAEKFVSGWETGRAIIEFQWENRRVRFVLPLPVSKDFRAQGKYEQAVRSRWRALCLVLKAKLEAITSGITTFDDEFLAHLVIASNNQTVGDHLGSDLVAALNGKQRFPMLPAGDK